MKLRLLKSAVCIFLTLTASLAIAGPEPVADDWHANLQIPTGSLSLIVTIAEDDDGNLSAHLESPDQAPGQKIPISEVSVVDDHISITIAVLGASIEADWDDDEQHWTGTFSQGLDLPIVLKRGLPADKPVVEGLDGDWDAVLNRNGVDLRLILHIKTTDQGTNVTLDSPDMMAMGISISDLTREGDSIGYKIPAAEGVFAGELTDSKTLTGVWTVPGQDDVSVTFVRREHTDVDKVRNRPQVPTEPYGYTVEEVTYENLEAEGVTLGGTLTLPEGDGPFAAAILISGSGPQNRDEAVFGHRPFLVLADHLTKQGIAVLRYDDRGVAQSTGDFSKATSADFATDANAAFTYLKSRPEIDHNAIGFVGHSEGGIIAPIAIQDNSQIAYMVMLAGPGTSSQQISKSQRRLIALSQGVTEEDIAKSEVINTAITLAAAGAVSTDDATAKIREILTQQATETLGIKESQVEMIIAQSVTPWTRYFLGYDPVNFVPQITIPILALNGELDLQVPAHENLDGLRVLLVDHPDAIITELPGLNHMFQHATTGALGEYNDIEETFSPEAMSIISDWINERFGSN